MIRQYLDVKFDRPIDKERDFISPGGYEIELKDGRTTRFDFLDYKGYIDQDDPSILHIIHSDLSLRAANSTGKAHPDMNRVACPLLQDLHERIPVIFDDIYEMMLQSKDAMKWVEID